MRYKVISEKLYANNVLNFAESYLFQNKEIYIQDTFS